MSSRNNPIDLSGREFRELGHTLVDQLADFLENIREMPVTPGESPREISNHLPGQKFPEHGLQAPEIMKKASELMLAHSLLNGHPKFLGYITSSPAPLGALAELLASMVNPNVGANILSPMATAIEKQTNQWLAEFVGISPDCGGILVSGGNMANFTGFLAGRTAMANGLFKEKGILSENERTTIYCSKSTHTWIEKAVRLFGHGTDSLRWIPTNERNQMDLGVLRETIRKDTGQGFRPVMVAATAGDVSTGAVDDLEGIAEICRSNQLWFHVDGAYGAPAAILPELKDMFRGLENADSVALDPHKWLYAPLEAGCALVKNPQHLLDTFSAHPDYYNFSGEGNESTNFYEFGLQNSRGFRALKVWVTLQQAGRSGYQKLIREDIDLAAYLFALADAHQELEAFSRNLSITTFRYVPAGMDPDENREFLNNLNEELLNRLQANGEAFLSNAIVRGNYCLRGCVVNFRTTEKDMEEIMEIVVREGRTIQKQNMSRASQP